MPIINQHTLTHTYTRTLSSLPLFGRMSFFSSLFFFSINGEVASARHAHATPDVSQLLHNLFRQ